MAKVPFTKLKCKTDDSVKLITINDEISIEVKQYLPIQDKLILIGRVIELAHQEDFDYSNPLKLQVYTDLEMLFVYTNLSFTEKQREDLPKVYDMLYSSGILNSIKEAIPNTERTIVTESIEKTLNAIYQYQNSALGILDIIKNDYNNLDLNIDELNENIKDPEALGLIKDILTKFN